MSPEEFRDLQDRILYEDNHLLIFNKRTGEIVQGDKTGDEPLSETLKAFIAQRDGNPGQVFMGVPHRLDRPVSGVVLFAKTSKARTAITSWKWSSTPAATTRSVASWPTWAVPSKSEFLRRPNLFGQSFQRLFPFPTGFPTSHVQK